MKYIEYIIHVCGIGIGMFRGGVGSFGPSKNVFLPAHNLIWWTIYWPHININK